MRRWILAGAFVTGALVVRSAPARAAGDADLVDLAKEATVGAVDATKKAAGEVGEGVPFHVELERDEGKVVWSVDFAVGKKTANVVIDAKSGAVVEKEVDDSEDHSPTVSRAKVGLLAAVGTAMKGRGGIVVEARLRQTGGHDSFGLGSRVEYQVKIVDGTSIVVAAVDAATGAVGAGPSAAEPAKDGADPAFTSEFHVEPGELVSSGTNPFFPLVPGTVLELVGKDDGEDVRLVVTVTNDTKVVAGVETRVVEEREEHGGVLAEVSRNYFAISKRTNAVYYFGEDVDIYRGGKVASHEGAWVAGEKGARYGLMLPGTPLLGARYFQEIAPGVAMDRAEIVAVDASMETPAGAQAHCVETDEWGLGESKAERKAYARGVGLVRDGPLRLATVTRPK